MIFTYNHVGSIGKCIKSIAEQKTKYLYEIHICDDCSTDGTTAICKEYAQIYPHKIKLFLQNRNTYFNPPETNHTYQAYKRLSTKYWAHIDGDDYWCDENFIQSAIDTLEINKNYSMFGCNTLINNVEKGIQFNNIPEDYSKSLKKIELADITSPVVPFVLIQSRLYRRASEPLTMNGDFPIYLYHLSLGPLYYCDKVTGVYMATGKGIWSGLDHKAAARLCRTTAYRMCQYLDFKHENIWVRLLGRKDKLCVSLLKFFFGKKLGWKLWFFITFAPFFGVDVMNKNWVYPIKKD